MFSTVPIVLVVLAKRFASRVVGLAKGRIVFDGPPAELTDALLGEIYGGQSWME